MQPSKRRQRLDVGTWRGIFERFDAGDLSVAQFCQHEGLCVSSFHRWRSRVGAATMPASPITPYESSRPQASVGFVELGSINQACAAPGLDIRLELGGGVTLHIVRH
jgi:hypothetical protein